MADKTELVIILGLNPDGPGYMVLRKTADGIGKVSSSVHVRPKIDMSTGRVFLARAGPTTATAFEARHYRLVGDPSMIDLGEQEVKPFLSPDDPGTTRVAPPVQEVGASPGDGGSRLSLLQRQPRTTPATATPASIMSDAEARVAIDNARAAGMVLV